MSPFSSTLVRDQLHLSMSSIDGEYLHKSQGSVVLHNVVTGESSEFLSKDQFVSPPGSSSVCVVVSMMSARLLVCFSNTGRKGGL